MNTMVMSSLTKPNTNEASSIQTCPDMTIICMPCYNYSIKLSNWICKIWIEEGKRQWFEEKNKDALHVWSDKDKTGQWSKTTTAACECEKPGPALSTACQLAQWMPQPPLPAPSLLPSGYSSGHAHGCYSPAWLNASVPQNKGAECPL